MDEIDLHDIELCRLCLKKTKDITSIFAMVEISVGSQWCRVEKYSIADLIADVSSPDTISNCDGLPEQICGKCLQMLHRTFLFRRMIAESHKALEEMINNQEMACDEVKPATEFAQSASQVAQSTIDGPCFDTEFTLEILEDPLHCIDEHTAANDTEPSPQPTPNKCSVCFKVFPGPSRLLTHLITKHTVRNDQNVLRPFHCDKCDKCYTTHANLTIHKATHSGFKPFKCPICERSFLKQTSLTNHMSLHTGERKHQCDMCERAFTTANILHQHRKTHSERREHLCGVCEKGFHTSNDLRVHFRTHSGEKPFLCSTCGRRFARKTHLNVHLRTHSGEKPFKCDTCDRAFAQSGDLTAHIRIHTGEKPFPCKICSKSFNQMSGLRSHMRSHTGERNYICQICYKGFTQSSSLGRHLKFHSKSLHNTGLIIPQE